MLVDNGALHCRYLNLGGNPISVPTFPAFLTSLPSLDDLNLSGTGMGGSVPSTISALSHLTYARECGTSFLTALTVQVNLSILPLILFWWPCVVRSLDLSNNRLSGSIPTTVQAIPTLQYDACVALLVCCRPAPS